MAEDMPKINLIQYRLDKLEANLDRVTTSLETLVAAVNIQQTSINSFKRVCYVLVITIIAPLVLQFFSQMIF